MRANTNPVVLELYSDVSGGALTGSRIVFEHGCPECHQGISLRLEGDSSGVGAPPKLRCQLCGKFEQLGAHTRIDGKPYAIFVGLTLPRPNGGQWYERSGYNTTPDRDWLPGDGGATTTVPRGLPKMRGLQLPV